ncbi:MAG: hypothetical protein KAW42_06520 [Candidatus Atribacteria bacterium]|nr:hypothetical protein [Candidatus Atribacteria bacterium]
MSILPEVATNPKLIKFIAITNKQVANIPKMGIIITETIKAPSQAPTRSAA